MNTILPQQTQLQDGNMKGNDILGKSPLSQGNKSNAPHARRFLQISDGSILPNYCPNRKLTDAKKQDILMPLSPQQIQLILGTLLGDGCMSFNAVFPRYRVNHGSKQKDYVLHKAGILKNYLNTPPCLCPNLGFGKESCVFSTVSTPILEFIRKMCYQQVEGKWKKTVTQKWLDMLDWEGIAYWYMDDGALQKQGAASALHTEGFSMEENSLIAQWLQNKGLTCRIVETNGYYFLILNQESTYKLIEHIKPYVIPSMLYKINIKHHYCINCGEEVLHGNRKYCQKPDCQLIRIYANAQLYRDTHKQDPNYIQSRTNITKKQNLKRKEMRLNNPAYREKVLMQERARYAIKNQKKKEKRNLLKLQKDQSNLQLSSL
jgi:hypothetical protein